MDNAPLVLGGRYEVGRLIGRGGMAEVHIGHDRRLGRTVAIKILRSDLARDPSFLARFRREAQSAASLNHPAIVAVYDTGEDLRTDDTGNSVQVPFIVMEYVEGHTVREILRDGQAVPIEEAIEITAGVLAALEYSHHAGIVHRDIKPANVMITPTGAVKVMDFGIARAVADSAATMTQTQAVIGTAQYLSPEQARGETVDARSDLYSTGCLLFELLTGRPPFQGDSPVAVAYQHVREAPPVPSSLATDVPEVLDRITLKALAKDRDARYQDAAEFRTDLENALRGGAIMAPALGVAAVGATAIAAPEQATQLLTPEAPASPWATTAAPASITPAETPAEGEPEEPEKKSRKGLMWTLIAVAVAAIAAIVIMAMLNSGAAPADNQVRVPTIAPGTTKSAAQETLTKAGLEMNAVTDENSDENRTDTATGEQSPRGGEKADKGSKVTVHFFGAPQMATVPDLSGLTRDEAEAKLKDANLVLGDVNEVDAKSPNDQGKVLSQDPAAESQAQPDSAVNVDISSGKVTLPDVRGQKQSDAMNKLNGLGFKPSVTEVNSDAPAGTVTAQDPGPGAVDYGTAVKLSVSKGKAEQVQIPSDLRGQTYAQAAQELKNLGLVPAQSGAAVYSEYDPNTVASVSPAGGQMVDKGSTVTLTLSLGQSPSPTPSDSPSDTPSDNPTDNGGDEGGGGQNNGMGVDPNSAWKNRRG